MRDDSVFHLPIDYSQTDMQILVKVSLLLIEQYKNLDILSLKYDQPSVNSPSWASTFTADENEPWPLVTSNITHPVVRDVFGACGKHTKILYYFGSEKSMDNLILGGYIVDHILRVYPQLHNHTLDGIKAQRQIVFSNGETSSLCQNSLGPGETLISAYWRTMCANQVDLGKPMPSYVQLGNQNLVPPHEAQEPSWNLEDYPPMALQFSKNRRFFVSAKGRLGLAPRSAIAGDCVAICPGGKVPYVLRLTEDGKHIFIGDR